MILDEIRNELFKMQDTAYRDFNSKLIPTVDKSLFIGVRTPELRKYAKQLAKREDIEEFLHSLPHKYFDENQLHAFIVSEIKDFKSCVDKVNEFLPYIDNWATCDLLSFKKAFKGNLNKLENEVKRWISSGDTYTVRFGIGVLLEFYLDDAFDPQYLEWVAGVKSDEYYVRMMQAWYFATALAKQYDETIPYIENKRLDEWVHRKTIQKAKESYRVSDDTKAYLNSLK